MITYLGQGARLIVDGESVIQNIFYRSIPGPINGGLYWYVYLTSLYNNLTKRAQGNVRVCLPGYRTLRL